MDGRGVTNYAAGKPSYGFSTATTEFDDALMARGIVTFEQAMIAKGASPSEARRLAELKENGSSDAQSEFSQHEGNNASIEQAGDGYDDVSVASGGSEDDKDEEFIKKYRQMRINDLKKGRSSHGYGDVVHISRPDWNREVNEASRNGLWVVVNLTRSSTSLSRTHNEVCDKVEGIIRYLADKFADVKFVSIPSNSAIENWPAENLPTLFCYRYGKMHHQLIGVDALGGAGINSGRLEWRLAMLGVLHTDLEEDPRPDRTEKCSGTGGDRSAFGGTMSQLATARGYESDDYDYVD
mmetsp:Transcript_15069/g.31982  ORF Transcript_15069/g.31982 Transcript_15069/m.31982 type:complete len:295 (-) Transcript_15069:110-994(-)|eukprot:CAMPEP_0183720054 /NCGR_PEP_ID=MMETSP0737-20130205/12782_1 /TAXON_ID=385413 /ORGANISM="Thalassiosira miniscula, Strain CCMP1093" /LENGTH=294 /DNA_ID=CAMNT_0025949861 /DNA_START=45 /DNA_END=929 /DNA_ORIENTATION=+